MILIHRLLVKLPVKHCHAATLGKLFTPLCPSQTELLSTGQTAVMPCGWEGDCRPGGKYWQPLTALRVKSLWQSG